MGVHYYSELRNTQGSPQVPLVQRNHEIQALSSYCPNQPFAMRIRMRCPNWRAHHSQAKGELQFLIQFRREDRIAVVDQEPLRMITGDGFAEPLQGHLAVG